MMTNSDDGWVRPSRAAAVDSAAKLRTEVAGLGSMVNEVARAARRQQATMLVVTLALGLFLPFGRSDAGGRNDLPTDHHLLGLFGQLFDPDLDFVGGTRDSQSAGVGRTMMLFGIGLIVVCIVAAIAGLGAVLTQAPERAAIRSLRWGGIGLAIGVLVTLLGAWVLGRRTDISVISLGLLFMIITAVLVLVAASDARERA